MSAPQATEDGVAKLNPKAMASKHGGRDDSKKIEAVRDKLREARDVDIRISRLSEETSSLGKKKLALVHEELPAMFAAAGIDSMGLEADGDLPAYDTKLKPFYKASIPKDKKAEAFAWLRKNKHGDMIKNMFSVAVGAGDDAKAKKLEAFLKKEGFDYERDQGVPWNTLTAFVKEQIEDRKVRPSDLPLDLLGAFVGQVVTIKPRKAKD